MSNREIDLLEIDHGLVVAPAGCGKTHLIAKALKNHRGPKPVLVLTHTNAGVAALQKRLRSKGVSPKVYHLLTIDGWFMHLASTYPKRSKICTSQLRVENPRSDYPAVRTAARMLLSAGHINDILEANYSRLIVDEYQDCSVDQHHAIANIPTTIPKCVLGDPAQAIFNFGDNQLAHWDEEICTHFSEIINLDKPFRWIKAGRQEFGEWLLDVHKRVLDKRTIDLTDLPVGVKRCPLDGVDDQARKLKAALTDPPNASGRVLVIGQGYPEGNHKIAAQTPGAVTVESVDLKDFVHFARQFDLRRLDGNSSIALRRLVNFASMVMVGVDKLNLLDFLNPPQERADEDGLSQVAVNFCKKPTPEGAANLLLQIKEAQGTRLYRPDIFQACVKALTQYRYADDNTFHDTAIQVREHNRQFGRSLAKRSVGSTFLLKGLEAEVSVVLEADNLSHKHRYVAMTRGSHKLVICSQTDQLKPLLEGR